MRGTMLWFNAAKDLGFILTEEGERLSVLGPGFAGGEKPTGRCARSVVAFDVDESNGHREAKDVTFVVEDAPRRARRRHGGTRR